MVRVFELWLLGCSHELGTPHVQADPENVLERVDFTAPSRKELTYRVTAINAEDTDQGASATTLAVTLVK